MMWRASEDVKAMWWEVVRLGSLLLVTMAGVAVGVVTAAVLLSVPAVTLLFGAGIGGLVAFSLWERLTDGI
jgi:hypothetical protein